MQAIDEKRVIFVSQRVFLTRVIKQKDDMAKILHCTSVHVRA